MALTFQTKIKNDMLNSWVTGATIYVVLTGRINGAGTETVLKTLKIENKPTSTTQKLVFSGPYNLAINDGDQVMAIRLSATNAMGAEELAFENITPETFTYGGTFRNNQIEIELV